MGYRDVLSGAFMGLFSIGETLSYVKLDYILYNIIIRYLKDNFCQFYIKINVIGNALLHLSGVVLKSIHNSHFYGKLC